MPPRLRHGAKSAKMADLRLTPAQRSMVHAAAAVFDQSLVLDLRAVASLLGLQLTILPLITLLMTLLLLLLL
jgi:hypothetical protein